MRESFHGPRGAVDRFKAKFELSSMLDTFTISSLGRSQSISAQSDVCDSSDWMEVALLLSSSSL